MPKPSIDASDALTTSRARRRPQHISRILNASARLVDHVRLHYEALEEHVGTGRHDYTLLVALTSELGLVDRYGKRPSSATIARTWSAVTAERAKAAEWRRALHRRAPSQTAPTYPPTFRTAPPQARAPPPPIRRLASPAPGAPAVDTSGHSRSEPNDLVEAAFAQAEARRVARSFEQ